MGLAAIRGGYSCCGWGDRQWRLRQNDHAKAQPTATWVAAVTEEAATSTSGSSVLLHTEATVVRGRSSWPRKRRKPAMDRGGCLFPIGRSVDDGGPAERQGRRRGSVLLAVAGVVDATGQRDSDNNDDDDAGSRGCSNSGGRGRGLQEIGSSEEEELSASFTTEKAEERHESSRWVGKVSLLVGADATVVVHEEDDLVHKGTSAEE
ncbi:hypothetical protein BHE74_00055542 [Ensete ventricosum]|nr:hypothetical protein BHE74_00055542 [Ensete ventricosum]